VCVCVRACVYVKVSQAGSAGQVLDSLASMFQTASAANAYGSDLGKIFAIGGAFKLAAALLLLRRAAQHG